MRTIGACTKNLPAGLDVTASFKRIFFTRNLLHNGFVHIVRPYRVGTESCPPGFFNSRSQRLLLNALQYIYYRMYNLNHEIHMTRTKAQEQSEKTRL